MTEQIKDALVAAIGDIAPVFLDEAEVDEFHFVTYDITITPFYTKDGVYKLVADVRLYCISNDPDQAKAISASVKAAIADQMTEGQFRAVEVNETPKCYEGIWDIETNFQITQNY